MLEHTSATTIGGFRSQPERCNNARQGREIAKFYSDDSKGFIPNAPFAWGPQPHKGTIFFTDLYSGLWAVCLLSREDSKAKTTSMQ